MHPLHHKHLAQKLRKHKWHFLFQLLAATLFLYLVLLAFNDIETNIIIGSIGISSIAATTFAVFALPQNKVAAPLRIIGAYAIAIFMGVLIHQFLPMLHTHYLQHSFATNYVLGGAIVMALTMFLMGLFEAEHPPAAGFALGLVLAPWNMSVLLVVSTAIILLALIHYVFRAVLIDFL